MAMDPWWILCQSQTPKGVGSRPPCSVSFEIFLDALFREAESASQGNFCKIIAVKTRNVLFVGASDRLLRLHHFHRIGDTRGQNIARFKQSLRPPVNVALLPRFFYSA